MSQNQFPPYVVAEGERGLEKVLQDLLNNTDQAAHAVEHYILYQMEQQQSLIKVDMSVCPFRFWHYDLLGRPATRKVKKIVAQFLASQTQM